MLQGNNQCQFHGRVIIAVETESANSETVTLMDSWSTRVNVSMCIAKFRYKNVRIEIH